MARNKGYIAVAFMLMALFTSCATDRKEGKDLGKEHFISTLETATEIEHETIDILTYPDEYSPEVKLNAEFLAQQMGIRRVAALPTAKRLETLGVKEIIKLQVVETTEDKCSYVQIADKDGNDYFILLGEGGGIWTVQKGDRNGDLIWVIH